MKVLITISLLALFGSFDSYAQKEELVTKDFDVKAIFGVDLGSSKDSLNGLTTDVIPKKKSTFATSFLNCKGLVQGVRPFFCKVVVQNNKINMLTALFLDSDGAAVAKALTEDTFTLDIPGKEGWFSAHYKNCMVFFEYRDGDFQINIVSTSKKKPVK